MARVNVYLPEDLADEARAAGLSVSRVTHEALRDRLRGRRTSAWLQALPVLLPRGVTHDRVIDAFEQVRAEEDDEWPEDAPAGAG